MYTYLTLLFFRNLDLFLAAGSVLRQLRVLMAILPSPYRWECPLPYYCEDNAIRSTFGRRARYPADGDLASVFSM